MLSYIHVIKREELFVICDVEMIWTVESQKKSYITSEIRTMHVPMNKFSMIGSNVKEGDVFTAIHNNGSVIKVCAKDEEATAKRRYLKRRNAEVVTA